MEERVITELARVSSRLEVHEEKLEAMHQTLREVLSEAKRTNGRIFQNEAAIGSLNMRQDNAEESIKELRATERSIRTAGWRIAALVIGGSGAVSGIVAAVAGALSK